MNLLRYLIIASLVSLLMACGGAEERKAAYMEKAEQSMKAGDLEKARIELKNVLQIDPKDAAAFFKLGTVFEYQKDYRKSFANYSKAEELEPDNAEYIAKIGRFHLVLAGDVEAAKKKLELIQSKDKNNVHGLMLEAGILLREKKIDDARAISERIFTTNPEVAENAVFLSTLYSRDKNYDAAIKVLDKALTNNPDDQSLMTVLANTLYLADDHQRAEELLLKIRENHPEIFENHVKLALFYKNTGRNDQAREVLTSAIELKPDEFKRKSSLIELIMQVDGVAAAISELEKMTKEYPGDGELRLALGQLYLSDNKREQAIKVFENAVNDFPAEETGIKSRVALASIYMQDKNTDKATSIIKDAMEVAPNDSDVNMVRAKIALTNKNTEQAIISLRTVVKEDQENIEAYLLLAAAHKMDGDNAAAEDILARAFENNRSNIESLATLAAFHIKERNVPNAEKAVDAILQINEKNKGALILKVKILNARKEYSQVLKYTDLIEANYPENPDGYLQAIPALLETGRIAELKELLEKGYSKTDKDIRILEAIIAIDSGQKRYDAATERLNQEIAKDSNNAKLHQMLGKVYDASGNSSLSIEEYKKAISIDKTIPDLYLELANIYIRQEKLDDAAELLNTGSRVLPETPKISMSLAQVYELAHKYTQAINTYEELLSRYQDNQIIINNLAALLSEYGTEKASLDRAVQLVEKIKNSPQPVILDTVGWVYYKSGDYENAVSVLEKVIDSYPDVNVFNYHLGMALFKSGNTTEAKKYLEKSVDDETEFRGRDIAEQTLKKLS